ncbi:hypothetical protein PRBEI_2001241600 [Prionailurus iriomotensis]
MTESQLSFGDCVEQNAAHKLPMPRLTMMEIANIIIMPAE